MNIKIDSVISEGFSYGKVVHMDLTYSEYNVTDIDIESEKNKFKCAINASINELESLKNELIDNDKEFIDVHKALILDPLLYDKVMSLIENGEHASNAFKNSVDYFISQIEESKSVYLKERVLDMKDIKKRVLSHIENNIEKKIEGKFILVIEELYPSLIMTYKDNLLGVIALKGGFTSHSAILCKSKEIPYVVVSDVKNINGEVIIDTREGAIITNPSNDLVKKYMDSLLEKDNFTINDFSSFGISLLANVSNNNELKNVIKYNMDGIGLYRSEIIFMNLDRPMTLEEQVKIYSEAIELMHDKSITIRTFDIGDDKNLSYIKSFNKGIDNYINNKEIFENQVKALIKSNKYNNLRIMFPMIETYEEFLYLKDWVLKIKHELNNDSCFKIGMMLETKEALKNISDFSDVDFISIGTNDLTRELYNINREDNINYNNYITELLSELEKVVSHCKKNNISLSICGEIASVKSIVRRLYRIGIKNFSISSAFARSINQALLDELEE